MRVTPTIVTFSHLRWDFVYQRPQQLLSRLAASHRVLFIEEPLPSDGPEPYWRFSRPESNVTVCQPHTPAGAPGFHAQQTPYLEELLPQLVESEKLEDCVVWFYTPMAVPLAASLKP